MSRLTAAPVNMSDEERELLQAIVRKHTSAQRLVNRARVVLLGAEGVSVNETERR